MGIRTENGGPRTAFAQVRQHLAPYLAVAGRIAGDGAVEVAGDASRVELSNGRRVLDFGSYAVTLLGHRHPDVLAAVRRQLDAMPVATRALANPVTADAAARLADYAGAELTRVYFGLSGADAVEAALKLARLASGRPRVLAVEGAYHGKSLGALAVTHNERYRAGLHDVLPAVTHLPPDDPEAVAREVSSGDVAALIFEPVQGENGVRPLDTGVLRAWCSSAADHGAFVIADEIQCGLRRCGERSLAVASGLPVDAVLLGKPLGGGVLPLSAAVCHPRMYAPLLTDPVIHSATFSGHPLACAALPATLHAIESLADHGRVLARLMGDGLADLARRHPVVAEVRGLGLLWGVDLSSARLAGAAISALARAGLLVSPCLSSPQTLRLAPPLVAGEPEVAEALGILDSVLAQYEPSGAEERVDRAAPPTPHG